MDDTDFLLVDKATEAPEPALDLEPAPESIQDPTPDPTEGDVALDTSIALDGVKTAARATPDAFYFYARTGTAAPLLYQIDTLDGALTPVTAAPALFATSFDGLFTATEAVPAWLEGGTAGSPLVFNLVLGSDRKNFLIGTDDNALFGLGGDDLVIAVDGSNLVSGGPGDDTLVGSLGDDAMFGGAGDDGLEGDGGGDLLFGGGGDDLLYGGPGANVLVGGPGADTFRLGPSGLPSPSLGGAAGPDLVVDFSAAEGDQIDLSLIAAQSVFAGLDLLAFVELVQVESDTHLRVTTPLGQVSTAAVLLGVEADSLTPASLTATPPTGLAPLK